MNSIFPVIEASVPAVGRRGWPLLVGIILAVVILYGVGFRITTRCITRRMTPATRRLSPATEPRTWTYSDGLSSQLVWLGWCPGWF